MKEHFKKWFNSLPAGDHPKDGEEWAWEGWQAALESRVSGDTRDKALEEAAEICKTWNTTPGSRLAAEILALKSESRVLADTKQEPVARGIFTNRKKPDVEWLTDTVTRDTSLFTHPTPDDASVPDGYALVPVRMTAAMINAWSGGKTVTSDEVAYRTAFQDAWKRVLDAAIDRARQSGEEGK